VAKAVALVETPGSKLDLPLDLAKDELQRRVWRPCGNPDRGHCHVQETPQKLECRNRARGGEACAANALAVVVPVTRVVRTDRSLARLSLGHQSQRALLQKEQEASPDPGTLFMRQLVPPSC